MRALLQRVSSAIVSVDEKTVSSIQNGLLILLGIEEADDSSDIDWLSSKISQLRIFDDAEGKMNLSIQDVAGEVIVVSQFTLHASTKKGNRPSFLKAAPPATSEPLYRAFCDALSQKLNSPVSRGIFGADMQVTLTNDGPVTLWIDSRDKE
jgi:D-tyrosyl-tRNA(Tyr) deacylase